MFLRDELMQRAQTSSRAGPDLDRNDAALESHHEIDLGAGRAAFAQPVCQFAAGGGARESILQVLSHELLGNGAVVDELDVIEPRYRPPREAAYDAPQNSINGPNYGSVFAGIRVNSGVIEMTAGAPLYLVERLADIAVAVR